MYRWKSLLGHFEQRDDLITFKGEPITYQDIPGPSIGNYICDQHFSGGTIRGRVRFETIGDASACEFILSYQPSIPGFVTAGVGGGGMFSVRSFVGKWNYHANVGDRANIEAGIDYELQVHVLGSRITVTVDGVDVIMTNLPFVLPQGQVGIWCSDVRPIYISNYSVESERPMAFVVMQFTKPYNELYSEVIRPICEEFGITSVRADEAYGPGLIVADIARQIAEAKVIVAEITPSNPNVYYELGYAHALNKPTILIAEKGTALPFDVSPFRILFYENSIEGKRQIEEGLKKHLKAILSVWGGT